VCQCDEPEEPSEKGKKQKDAPVPTAAAAAAVKSTSRVRRDASGAAGPSSAKQEKLRTAASVSWDLIKAKYEWQEEYSRAVSTGREKPPPLRLPTEVNSLEDEFKRQNGRMPTHMWVQMWD
jgi:hypothetical protein